MTLPKQPSQKIIIALLLGIYNIQDVLCMPYVTVYSTSDGCDQLKNKGWNEHYSSPISSLQFSVTSFQFECDDCWDTCDEKFGFGKLKGKDIHSNNGIKSIYIPEGYVARSYTSCNADYLYEDPGFVSTLDSGCNIIDNTSSFYFFKKEYMVAVYSEQKCLSHGAENAVHVGHVSLTSFSVDHEQYNCHNCWDSCLERFDDGSSTHGNTGSLVNSIYIPKGYVARAYRDCVADYNYDIVNFVQEFEEGCADLPDGISSFNFIKKSSTVTVYSTADGCKNKVDEKNNPFQLSFNVNYKQYYCDHCFDTCDEYFINGQPLDDQVKSIEIPTGWWAKAYRECNSDNYKRYPGYAGILKSGCHIVGNMRSFHFVKPRTLVTVYDTSEGCEEGFESSAAMLSFPTDIDQRYCKDCWDTCSEHFEDGTDVHSEWGSRVRSIYIPYGYIAKTYKTCNADFEFTSRAQQEYTSTIGSGCSKVDFTTTGFKFYYMG